MARTFAISSLSLLLLLGCSGRAPNPRATESGPESPSRPAVRGSDASKPAQLNYELPKDIPRLLNCRLRLELIHLTGQQIVWQTDREPSDIHQTIERELAKSSWTLTANRIIDSGTAIVGTKGERKCSFIIGQPADEPTTVILLLNFIRPEK